jgi:2-oxoglutarate ferredoxin oxidoreductase subunit delta
MASGRIIINEERCKGCELCIAACPPAVINLSGHLNARGYKPATLLDPEQLCTGCALCAVVCPDAAITVFRDLPLSKVRRPLMEVV